MKALKTAVYIATGLGLSCSALAYDAGDWVVRAGITQVSPDESSSVVSLDGDGGTALGTNSGVNVDSNSQLGLNIQYMLTKQWGIELLAATPFKHDIGGTGDLAGVAIGETKHLPPTLSAVYYFDTNSAVMPYVGLGLNYTLFFEDKPSDTMKAAFGATDLSLDNSLGLAAQAGLDYQLNDQWLVNASIRWINIETDATIDLESGSQVTTSVDIDPFVYTLSVGYRF